MLPLSLHVTVEMGPGRHHGIRQLKLYKSKHVDRLDRQNRVDTMLAWLMCAEIACQGRQFHRFSEQKSLLVFQKYLKFYVRL